jgi:autotransporter-associated beta strand protein
VALTTRNSGLVGDVRVNTNSGLGIGNNFALGSGRLIVNGGFVRSDIGNNNFVSTNITLNNQLVLQGDFNTNAGVLTLLGDVAMSDVVGAGATRIWNMAGGDLTVRGVVSGAMGSNLIKRGQSFLTLSGANTYQGYTQIDRGTIVVAGNVLPGVAGPLGNSESPIVLGVESTNNSGSLGIGGRFTIGRDLLVAATAGTAKTFKIQAGSGFDLRAMIGDSSVAGPGFSVCFWYRDQTNSIQWMNGFSFGNTERTNVYIRWIRNAATTNMLWSVVSNIDIGM